jgi:pyrroloquinoline-quinone synthase
MQSMTHNELKSSLDAAFTKWDLLQHPFYQAWSAGTLPDAALASYAEDYGMFIRTLPQGWETLGDKPSAQVERDHAALWDTFAAALGTKVGEARAAHALVAVAKARFAAPVDAAGALYAFEAQQPKTAESKLEGLRTHYAHLPEGVKPYFEAHAAETPECEMLLAFMAALPRDEQDRAVESCEALARSMYDALTSIHNVC